MRARGAVALMFLVAAMVFAASCQRSIFRQYEYEEEIYLKLDGSATVRINSSIAALVALRGLELNTDQNARVDRDRIGGYYAAPGVGARVTTVWRRSGRRFAQIRLDVDDIRQLGRVAPMNWSTYQFAMNGDQYRYRQVWGAAVGKPVPGVNWDGSELVAVRIHLPSKIDDHNAPSREIERGNIVEWEQPLAARLRGEPVVMEVYMQAHSILYRTLTIFGLSAAAAVLLLAAIVFWIRKKGAQDARPV